MVYLETVGSLTTKGTFMLEAPNMSLIFKNLTLQGLRLVLHAMEHISFTELTNNKLLFWRDTMRDAVAIGIRVEFLLPALQRLACGAFAAHITINMEEIDKSLKKEA